MNFFEADDLTNMKLPNGSVIGLRPKHMELTTGKSAIINGTLALAENLGEYVLGHLINDNGTPFVVKMERIDTLKTGDKLSFKADKKFIHRFDKKTEKSI